MPKERIYKNTPVQEGILNTIVEVQWARDCYVSVGVSEVGNEENSLYADMSWKQLNELITILRKARDQAFGRAV